MTEETLKKAKDVESKLEKARASVKDMEKGLAAYKQSGKTGVTAHIKLYVQGQGSHYGNEPSYPEQHIYLMLDRKYVTHVLQTSLNLRRFEVTKLETELQLLK